MAIYRDVLMVQLGTGADLVNVDLEPLVADLARQSSPRQTMERIDAIELARHRLDVLHSPDFIPPAAGARRRIGGARSVAGA